jgi:hypothetical protein
MFIPTRKSQTEITVQFFEAVNNTERHNPNQYGQKRKRKIFKETKKQPRQRNLLANLYNMFLKNLKRSVFKCN